MQGFKEVARVHDRLHRNTKKNTHQKTHLLKFHIQKTSVKISQNSKVSDSIFRIQFFSQIVDV